jgi:hypothetical protein
VSVNAFPSRMDEDERKDQKMEQLPGKYFHGTIAIEEERMIEEWYESPGTVEGIQFSEGEILGVKAKIWRAVKAKTIDAERRAVVMRRTFLHRRLC